MNKYISEWLITHFPVPEPESSYMAYNLIRSLPPMNHGRWLPAPIKLYNKAIYHSRRQIMLQDIFNALSSGASQGGNQPQAGNQSQAGGDLLSGLLGSLMGGQSGAVAPSTANQAGNQSQAGGEDLSGLLGSLLGGQVGGTPQGGAMQAGNQPQTSGGELSGLLGSLLGGQTSGATAAGGQAGMNPIMNLVGSGQNPMVNMLIQPVVDQIAQKLGISPAIAMMVVTFAVHYMLSNHGNKVAKGEDISGVLEQHSSQDYLHSTGISQQLANQTGLKPAVAANALSEVFKLLGAPSPSN
jgi:hypothetical protein